MEVINECPNSIYLMKKERKEHCTFKLYHSKKAAVAAIMQLALNKATEVENILQDVLTIVTQLKESNND